MKTVLQKMKKMVENKQTKKLTMLGEIEKEGSPFKVLISTILSSRTKDDTTFGASNRLFNKYKNPEELSKAKTVDIKRLIKPVAFYKTKSKKIKQVAEIIHKEYNNDVPIEMEELLDLPLVGRKTANCVLVYGFRKPAIPVDVHVHRISNRLGIVETESPEETEIELAKIVNRKYWIQINEYFVRFGQLICKPINPRCNECEFNNTCKYSQDIKKNN
tara:strand:+ start:5948 stop:6598 length:651 start_codon:yes stop_codon:yes gene_type:complete